ncbi:MAG: hypothetical protein J6C82_01935 [Clostridia bacterium]|nr:hypothetical protein [Clostridia bacterium]
MNIKLELLSGAISDAICEKLAYMEINADETIDTRATAILAEIQNILTEENLSDFDAIEKIVAVLQKNKLSTGTRHDF